MKISVSSCRDTAEPSWSEARKPKRFCTASLGTVKSLFKKIVSVTLHPIKRMKLPCYPALWFALGLLLTGCGEPERPRPVAIRPSAARVGGEFDQVGTVTMFPGESCASQIVFIFHTGRSTSISLAAPWRQSQILKDAVRSHHTVRVVGKWRRGKAPDCYYVEATTVELLK